MKKILLSLPIILLVVGCSLSGNTPTKKTEEFLNRYTSLSEGVISDLELSSEMTGLTTDEHKEKYIDAMKRQYTDMEYEVTEEEVDGDEATVEVKVSVYDMYKARTDAENYINMNQSEFYMNDTMVRSPEKVNEYILNKLSTTDEKIDYTIEINLVKNDGKWEVIELEEETKEKLHGIYNYELN